MHFLFNVRADTAMFLLECARLTVSDTSNITKQSVQNCTKTVYFAAWSCKRVFAITLF